MTGKLFMASLMFLASSAAHAGSGGWTHESHQISNEVAIDVYHRAPYALTGTTAEPAGRSSGEWARETRQLPKTTLDVYRR